MEFPSKLRFPSNRISSLFGRRKKQATPQEDALAKRAASQATPSPDFIQREDSTGSAETTNAPVADRTYSSEVPSVPTPCGSQAVDEQTDDDTAQDLWARAFERLRNEERELASEYDEYLQNKYKGAGSKENLPLQKSVVESVVSQLQESRTRKQWSFSVLGTNIVVRSQVEKTIKFLRWSDDLVKTALSTQPYAALAWSGTTLLLPLLQSAMGKHQALLDGLVTVNEVQFFWRLAETNHINSLEGLQREEVEASVVTLYSEVLKYQARAICHLSKPTRNRAWSTSEFWSELASHVSKVSEDKRKMLPELATQRFKEALETQLQAMNESTMVLKEIRDIITQETHYAHDRYQDQNERNLLRDLAFNYQTYKDFNHSGLTGTCEWFLKDDGFQQWRNDEKAGMLAVLAGPGCGKSVLSRFLIDERHLQKRITTSQVCYFFFKDGIEDRADSASAVAAILHQLFAHDPSEALIKHGLTSHRNLGDKLKSNFSELWTILLRCARDPEAGEIICVLDALDECTRNRQQLLNVLRKFYSDASAAYMAGNEEEVPKLKFLVTSRQYDFIDPILGYSTVVSPDQHLGDVRKEIDIVIDYRVNTIMETLTVGHRKKLSDRLKSFENRTYLWLALIFDIIERKKSSYSKPSMVESLLTQLPLEVSDVYEAILSRSEDETQTKTLLQLVLASAQPLALSDVNVALTLALDSAGRLDSYDSVQADLWPAAAIKSVVENLCGLFVCVYESKLYFIHQTAREFLTDTVRSGKWKGCLDVARSHYTLSLACMRHLLLIEVDDEDGDDEDGDDEDGDDEEPAFNKYARCHWTTHFMQCAPRDESVLVPARDLCRGADPRILHWFQRGFYNFPWKGSTDLCIASGHGLIPVMERILSTEKDVDINAASPDYGTSMQAAAYYGKADAVTLLLQHGANPNLEKGNRMLRTPLGEAASRGDIKIVQVLLEGQCDNRADINFKNTFGWTAFDWALRRGRIEAANAIIDSANERGETLDISEKTVAFAVEGDAAIEATTLILEYSPEMPILKGNFMRYIVLPLDPSNIKAMHTLLDRTLEAIVVSDRLMETVFRLFDASVARRITEAKHAQITQQLADVAAGNSYFAVGILAWLLEEHGEKFRLTEALLENAAADRKTGFDALVLLREERPAEFRFTDKMARLAIKHPTWGCGRQILEEFSRD